VLEGARAIVAEEGLDAVLVAAVALQAGVGIGTIYARFGDRAGLLRAIQEREAIDMQRACLTRLDRLLQGKPSPRNVVEGAVAAVVGVFREHSTDIGQLMALGARDPRMSERGSVSTHAVAEAFVAALSGAMRTRGAAPEVVADMIFRTTFATCAHRVTYGSSSQSPRRLSWTSLEADLCRMAVAYAGLA
jgi:AcrR family transcriptional regulator